VFVDCEKPLEDTCTEEVCDKACEVLGSMITAEVKVLDEIRWARVRRGSAAARPRAQ
jgi:hypothetical protein